ncbi:sensor histidine kinase [Adhaeribacter arboris]|uniref:Sensor histidine kinase n=2 Tax=Adhaeribacter arboris TaxID=2072846 RepID=A0A2T2YNR8_9BACT|nr:sensor histidine kinase [Adhaeribacter arboris]
MLHVFIWSLLLLLPFLVSSTEKDYRIGDIPGFFFALGGLIHAVIFYGNAFFLYPVFLNKRFWWLYILLSVLLIVGSFQVKFYLLVNWFPPVLANDTTIKFVFGPSVAFFIISIVYRKVIDQIRVEEALKERRTTQLETELKFLRSQINPHFLFNILTNLVSLARKKSDKLEESLLLLSDLMRYSVYEAPGKNTTLQKEIEYLNSYIQLQKLRFGKEVKMDYSFNLSEEENAYTIEPMLLIPFVENAFKHGIGYNKPSWIDIRLSVNEGKMTFAVSNSFEPTPAADKEENSNIGISNVKSRLNLLYKDKHTLLINDQNNTFHIILTLLFR